MRAMIPRNRKERGIAGVEFALALPILLVTLFGVIEFGLAFYKQQVITAGAREAARAGVVATDPRPNASEIETIARDYIDLAGLEGPQATVVVSGAGGDAGGTLRVEVNYPAGFEFLATFINANEAEAGTTSSGGFDSAITLTASVEMDLE